VPVEALAGYRPRYNIAPTDQHWIVRSRFEDREILPARWGLINFWMTDRRQAFKNINARAETVLTLPTFREAFKARRCVVPADGFFEWTGQKDSRQPIWYHRPDGGLIYFAGLYESWRPAPDEKERTFTIITTTPNSLIEPVHNRMPVILEDGAIDDWLYVRQHLHHSCTFYDRRRTICSLLRWSHRGRIRSRLTIPNASAHCPKEGWHTNAS
jgi:putative SOS response-associated peptidase YedK